MASQSWSWHDHHLAKYRDQTSMTPPCLFDSMAMHEALILDWINGWKTVAMSSGFRLECLPPEATSDSWDSTERLYQLPIMGIWTHSFINRCLNQITANEADRRIQMAVVIDFNSTLDVPVSICYKMRILCSGPLD